MISKFNFLKLHFVKSELIQNGEIIATFINLGITNLIDAINYVHQLPYGRNTDRSDFKLVLKEQQGTCSTKHALIAKLAAEQNKKIKLCLGLFLMNKNNTPAIANVLQKYNLTEIPEAHCYLLLHNNRFDITFPEKLSLLKSTDFIKEQYIQPEQIGDYKVQWHQQN